MTIAAIKALIAANPGKIVQAILLDNSQYQVFSSGPYEDFDPNTMLQTIGGTEFLVQSQKVKEAQFGRYALTSIEYRPVEDIQGIVFMDPKDAKLVDLKYIRGV